MELKANCNKRLQSHSAVHITLIISLFIDVTSSFNIQEAKYGKIFTGDENGSQFGFSMTFHENDQGKWLVVGAPKKLEEKQKLSSNKPFHRQKDGAVYLCPLQESKPLNSTCSKIPFDTKKHEGDFAFGKFFSLNSATEKPNSFYRRIRINVQQAVRSAAVWSSFEVLVFSPSSINVGHRNCVCVPTPLLSYKTATARKVIYSCDFESCTLEQLSFDDFDWTRTNVETPSDNTGPSRDHTFESTASGESGYYMFMEASRSTNEHVVLSGRSAIIATPTQRETVGDCLRFWYHMYGLNVESLNVYVKSNDTGMIRIWNEDGDQGNMWIQGYVTVISEQPYQVLFEGLKEHWLGDIGIDDVKILKGQCPEDIDISSQSAGTTMTRNSKTGELLTCAPTWRYNCSGQIHSSGACYLFNKELSSTTMSILTPCRTQVCSTGQVDLVFLIDGSHSVSDIDFSNIKLWLRNVVSSLPISSTYIQVGVLVYTDTTSVAFYLNEFHKIEDIRKAVEAMLFEGGNTKTGKAIDVAREDMFSVERGMRPGAKHVAVVMTDGKSQDDIVNPSRRAKDQGITMFAIGVGNANETELRAISSDPRKYLFTIKDYSALNEIKKALQDSIAALESRGKTSTSEQGQAGLSATFYGDVAIIGAPGLDYWSGGYSSYYPDKNRSGIFSRELVSFQSLLNFEATIRDSVMPDTKTISDADHTTEEMAMLFTSQPINVPNQVKYAAEVAKEHGSKSILEMTKPTNSFPTSVYSRTNIGKRSDASTETAVSFNRTKRTATQADGFIGKFENKADKLPFLNEKNSSSEVSPILQRGEDVANLYTDAYFGYSMTTGRFVRNNRIDLAFGSPRSSSFGAVFIVKQSRLKEHSDPPRLVGRFQSKQMGSYFGFSLCAADLNGDGFDELIVGAPLWMGKQQDEGRTFIYVSGLDKVSNKVHRREVVLSGHSKVDSRFGFSFATPGDLNKDGYDDIIIGAPSNNILNSGSVYVYYGSRSFGKEDQTFQVISASQRNERLSYFGFSLDASQDIDENGYNDLAIGAPGSDRAMVLLSRPVIHTAVQFYASPSFLNLTNPDMDGMDRSLVCKGNGTKICATLTACFSASGINIPENITLSFTLLSDTQFLHGSKPRGKIFDPKGEIRLTSNSKLYCKDFIINIKIPVRYQLIPMVFQMNYGLSQSMPSSPKSAVLDVFDAKPKSTIITFAKACFNLTCLSNLQLSCDILRDDESDQSSVVVINYDRRITISINLTNKIDAAYDVEVNMHFPSGLYLIQVVPMLSDGKRCLERVTQSNWVKKATKETVLDFTEGTEEVATHQLKLMHKDSVMKQGEQCLVKLQFGMLDSYQGGNVNFTFKAQSSSVELDPSTSRCNASTVVHMRTDLTLRGGTKDDSLTFLKREKKNYTTVEDIGPLVRHMYYVMNNGPSKVPNATLKVEWPKTTSSGHAVFRLLNVKCQPSEACECHNLDRLIEPIFTNGTSSKDRPTRDEVDFGLFVQPNEMKKDKNTSQYFVDVTMNCNKKSEEILCQHLYCNIHNLQPSQAVVMQLEFRLWEDTFLKGKAWKATLFSDAKVSTESSPFLVDSNGNNNISFVAQVKTEAFNGNFQFPIDDETNRKGTWLVILISVVGGVTFLLLLILLLAQVGFFKSKYKEHLQEELQWTNSYRYTVAKQQEADALNNQEMNTDIPKPKLSTFQRSQTPPSVL